MIPRNLALTVAILCSLTFGMSLYLWQLRRREATSIGREAIPQHVSAPTNGKTENITLVVAHDDTSDLRTQSTAVPVSSDPQDRAEEILRQLLSIYQSKASSHALSAAAEIRSVYLVPPGLAVMDVNAAFADGQTSGVLAEQLTVISFTQTLTLNLPDIAAVKILVDGKERETLAGHVDISGSFSATDVSQLANQLAAR